MDMNINDDNQLQQELLPFQFPLRKPKAQRSEGSSSQDPKLRTWESHCLNVGEEPTQLVSGSRSMATQAWTACLEAMRERETKQTPTA